MKGLASTFRHAVWRLFRFAGYSISSIAKDRSEAQRRAREPWRWLDTLGIDTLIDVGANTGQFAQRFLALRPECTVYSFEPLPDCFDELQTAMADTPRFAAYNVALGETNGEATFFRSVFSPSSSLLEMADAHKELFPETREISTETVPVARLDDYADEIDVRGGLLIKLDVQGAEAQVLRGGRRLVGRADAVLAEVGYFPLYEGQATFQEIAGLLDECGLTFTGIVDQYLRPDDSLPVYGDALFVRRSAVAGPHDGSTSTQRDRLNAQSESSR